MPVKIGDNLTLEENKLSAVYKELYTKLNRAYAWTNTQTSGSGGSFSVYTNSSNFLNYINCSNSSNFIIGSCSMISSGYISSSYSYSLSYILNGELFVSINTTIKNYKIGNKNDWILCASYDGSYSSETSWSTYIWAINSSGKLYYISYVKSSDSYKETQIGSDSGWTDLTYCWAINNGKLYRLSGSSATQIGSDTTWTYLGKSFVEGTGGYSDSSGAIGINNNYYYYMYNRTPILAVNASNIKYFRGYATNNGFNYIDGFYIDSNDDLYVKTSGASSYTKIGNIPNIIRLNGFTTSSYHPATFVTSDGKAGFILLDNGRWSYYYFNENIFWSDISFGNEATWYPISSISSTSICVCYAVGDGKLYEIRFSSNNQKEDDTKRIYNIIDNNNNWKKVIGCINPYTIYGTDSYIKPTMYAFNSDDEIETKTTVYTTKHPQIDDITYNNENMEEKSNVISSTLTTVTDDFMTYTRDITKDSYFTKIPPASIHETVSAMDLLNATNPNN